MVDVNIPTVKSFLYCITLRNGVKIMGWVFLIGHFLTMFGTPLENLRIYWDCSLIPLYEDEETGSHICPEWLKLELLITALADWTLSLVQILIAFLLLLGVYQTKSRLILQWVILQLSMLIMDIVLTNLSYLRKDNRYNMNYFYAFYIIWKSLEACGIYICYCYYISVVSDPAQDV